MEEIEENKPQKGGRVQEVNHALKGTTKKKSGRNR